MTIDELKRICSQSVIAANPHVFGKVTTPRTSSHSTQSSPRMNKTEAEYLRILDARLRVGEIDAILGFEAIKLRVGVVRCWYTPDFPVLAGGVLEFHEVKGAYVHDDARVKFQSAMRQYPLFRWVWAQKIKGEWRIR